MAQGLWAVKERELTMRLEEALGGQLVLIDALTFLYIFEFIEDVYGRLLHIIAGIAESDLSAYLATPQC